MSTQPRIIILRSNPIDPDPRVEKAAAVLVGAGYGVTLLGWDRNAALPVRQIVAGVDCIRLPIRAKFGRGLANLWSLLRWQWGLLRWLVHHRRDYAILHACDFDTVVPALACKFLFGKQIVYDIFDFYADHLRATPDWVRALIRALDLWAIRRVDALIVVDDARWAQVGQRLPENRSVILNTPEDVFERINRAGDKDEEKHRVFTNLAAQSEFALKIVYVGLLQIERGLLDVLALLGDHPEWRLDLAGFGGDEAQIIGLAEGLPNIAWHGRIPYAQALTLAAEADVLLALYDPALKNHRYASPNKLYEAMMLGKPVIVAEGTNIDRIVQEENCGLVVRYGCMSELAKAFERLKNDTALRTEFAANARRAYEKKHNWQTMATRLLHLYQQLRQNPPHQL